MENKSCEIRIKCFYIAYLSFYSSISLLRTRNIHFESINETDTKLFKMTIIFNHNRITELHEASFMLTWPKIAIKQK